MSHTSSCFYKNNIFNFPPNEDARIYPPEFSSVNPVIFKYGTPHAMPNIVNNQVSNCYRNYSGYKTIEQMCDKNFCPSGTLNQLTDNYRSVIPINDVNFYNCSVSR